jgi:hypothetical protein
LFSLGNWLVRGYLESERATELNDPGITGAGDGSCRRSVDRVVRKVQVGVVRDVEVLPAELEDAILSDLELTGKGDIERDVAGTVQDIPSRVAVGVLVGGDLEKAEVKPGGL